MFLSRIKYAAGRQAMPGDRSRSGRSRSAAANRGKRPRGSVISLMLVSALSLAFVGGCTGVGHYTHSHVFEHFSPSHLLPYYHCPHCGRVIPRLGHHECCGLDPMVPYHGFSATCWRGWPGDWVGCPVATEVLVPGYMDVPGKSLMPGESMPTPADPEVPGSETPLVEPPIRPVVPNQVTEPPSPSDLPPRPTESSLPSDLPPRPTESSSPPNLPPRPTESSSPPNLPPRSRNIPPAPPEAPEPPAAAPLPEPSSEPQTNYAPRDAHHVAPNTSPTYQDRESPAVKAFVKTERKEFAPLSAPSESPTRVKESPAKSPPTPSDSAPFGTTPQRTAKSERSSEFADRKTETKQPILLAERPTPAVKSTTPILPRPQSPEPPHATGLADAVPPKAIDSVFVPAPPLNRETTGSVAESRDSATMMKSVLTRPSEPNQTPSDELAASDQNDSPSMALPNTTAPPTMPKPEASATNSAPVIRLAPRYELPAPSAAQDADAAASQVREAPAPGNLSESTTTSEPPWRVNGSLPLNVRWVAPKSMESSSPFPIAAARPEAALTPEPIVEPASPSGNAMANGESDLNRHVSPAGVIRLAPHLAPAPQPLRSEQRGVVRLAPASVVR